MGEALATVLVVDDEENINYLVASALQLAGLRTLRAATGAAALDLALGESPDAIVLDVMLPDLDGFEVLRRLREAGCRAPVLFLTARTATADRVRGPTAGATTTSSSRSRWKNWWRGCNWPCRVGGVPTCVGRAAAHDLVLDTEARPGVAGTWRPI